MQIFLTIVILLFTFGILVGIHELGHFLAAKLQGVWVEEFAFGFGPCIFQKKYGDTLYRVNLIPLGGYVKLFGERKLIRNHEFVGKFEILSELQKEKISKFIKENKISKYRDEEELKAYLNSSSELSEDEKILVWEHEMNNEKRINDSQRYSNKSIPQRLLIVCAGVFMNLLLGVIIYTFFIPFIGGTVLIPQFANYTFLGSETSQSNTPVIVSSKPLIFKEKPIVSVDGEILKEYDDLIIILQKKNGEEYINVGYWGEGKMEYTKTMVKDLGVKFSPLITEVTGGSPAEIAGIKAEDMITKINGLDVVYENIPTILGNPNERKFSIDIKSSDGSFKTVEVQKDNTDIIGIKYTAFSEDIKFMPAYIIDYKNAGVFGGMFHAINISGYQIIAVGEIFRNAFIQRDFCTAAQALGGPIVVGSVINEMVKVNNYNDVINLIAMISLTLAVMNILPLPVVDGGHVVLLLLESVRKKQLEEKFLGIYNAVGLIFIMSLTLVITFKDIWQVFLKGNC